MDTRRLVIGMVLAMAVVFGWQLFVAYLYKKNPQWRPQPTTGQVAQQDPASTQPVGPGGTTAPATPATAPAVEAVATGTQPVTTATAQANAFSLSGTAERRQSVTIGESEAYPMRVELTTRGAAIGLVELKEFKAPDAQNPYIFQKPTSATDDQYQSLVTRAVILNGQTHRLYDADWRVESSDSKSATFAVDIAAPTGPVARVRKTFELTDQSHAGQGYLLTVRHAIENLSGGAMTAKLVYGGTTLPPRELLSGPDRQIIAGYDEERAITVRSHFVSEFSGAEKSSQDLVALGGEGLLFAWASASSVYFNAIVRPLPLATEPAGGMPIAKYVQHAYAQAINPDEPNAEAREVILAIETSELAIQPGATLPLDAEVFLGPKKRSLLKTEFYREYPRSYDRTLVIASGLCGICTFQWLIDVLVTLLRGFHFVLRDWGLAIICLVILVRAILHPVTKRSQVSMMKMGKMGPEIERLKKKYGDNKEELNRAMMEVYKQQGATPILGCLPMFLQMPIWIALWSSLQSTFELRQAPFLYGLTWIDDLAKPDLFIDFGRDINLFWGLHLSGINLLPILMAGVFWLQQKFTPKPPATTPEQEQQQKMMQWMTLLFPIFLYNGPSGLNLYILTSTAIGIVESKIVRDHIKQQEEREKQGPVIIDGPPPAKKDPKRRKDDDGPGPGVRRASTATPPKGGLAGWIANLQAKAEELRREADRRGK